MVHNVVQRAYTKINSEKILKPIVKTQATLFIIKQKLNYKNLKKQYYLNLKKKRTKIHQMQNAKFNTLQHLNFQNLKNPNKDKRYFIIYIYKNIYIYIYILLN